MTIRERAVDLARRAGFNASVGRTDKDGKYHPNVNALGKDVPVEWIERLCALVEGEMAAVMGRPVRALHAAKGRYNTQVALCNLFDLHGLPNTRPQDNPPPGQADDRDAVMWEMAEHLNLLAFHLRREDLTGRAGLVGEALDNIDKVIDRAAPYLGSAAPQIG